MFTNYSFLAGRSNKTAAKKVSSKRYVQYYSSVYEPMAIMHLLIILKLLTWCFTVTYRTESTTRDTTESQQTAKPTSKVEPSAKNTAAENKVSYSDLSLNFQYPNLWIAFRMTHFVHNSPCRVQIGLNPRVVSTTATGDCFVVHWLMSCLISYSINVISWTLMFLKSCCE